VIVNGDWLLAPEASGILEVAYQLALLGVDADDGGVGLFKISPLSLEVTELPITLRAGCTQALAVGVQRNPQSAQ
jgi:hypothetical protein